MAKHRIRWRGRETAKQIQSKMESRLKTVGAFLRRDIAKDISKAFRSGALRNKEGRFIGGKEKASVFRYNPKRGGNPSKPGEPPRADLGRLRQSMFWFIDKGKMQVVIGTTVKYGLWLEIGTSKMKPRPYLRPALNRNMKTIIKILTQGGRSLGKKKK